MSNSEIQTEAEKVSFALSYPFFGPKDDFIFIEGQTVDVMSVQGSNAKDWELSTFADIDLDNFETNLENLIPVVACGSNASPIQLRRKFSDFSNLFIPCLKFSLKGYVCLYGREIAGYGSIPATLEPENGAEIQIFVNFLTEELFDALNVSEALESAYQHIDVTGFGARDFIDINGTSVYGYQMIRGHFGLRLDSIDTQNSGYTAASQWEAQQHVMKELGLDLSVEHFIKQNISDPLLRKKRSAAL
tara:strand:+ start:136 stop:873 length:738 start_codon:yes stop_codon:yes gene_type:complete